MKWKLFLRRLSVSAPSMKVRSRLPWPVRAAIGVALLVLAVVGGLTLYEYGGDWNGPGRRELAAELERTRVQLRVAVDERDRARAAGAGLESRMRIEQAAQRELAQQVSQLEAERNRLRDDLAFFDSLLPSKARSGIVVRSFRMQPDGAGQWRFKLLVQQAGKAETDFSGTVQMQVSYALGGRTATLALPDAAQPESARAFDLAFRHYQRVEGTVALPAGGVARSVLVRVLSSGRVIAQQSFSL